MQREVEINRAKRQREIRRHVEGKWKREKIREKTKERRDKQ
jgi:hypothetical protein